MIVNLLKIPGKFHEGKVENVIPTARTLEKKDDLL
jgi:hypothetical protein